MILEYDPLNTITALNMAIVSINRILTTQSRAVLEQEYNNIINNLSIGNIESDKEITDLFTNLMSIITRKRVREEDSRRLRSYYDSIEQRRITYALSNIGLTEGKINSQQNSVIKNWLYNLVFSCVSLFMGDIFSASEIVSDSAFAYNDYQNLQIQREQENRNLHIIQSQQEQEQVRLSNFREELTQDINLLKNELQNSIWTLERQEITECDELQQKLLNSSWNLLRKYNIPDEYRLTQASLKNFYRAVNEQDPSKRSRMLRVLEDDFRVYAPYWLIRAKAAQSAGNFAEIDKCFAKFNEVWRPVLRKDPYKIESAKYEFFKLIQSNNDIDSIKPQLLNQLEIINSNTLKDDWEDFDSARAMAAFFEGNPSEILKLESTSNNPVIFHALRIIEQSKGTEQNLAKILEYIKKYDDLSEKIYNSYCEIMPLINKYQDKTNAKIFMAEMLLYGLGVDKDTKKAEKLFTEIAGSGNLYASFALVQSHFADKGYLTVNAQYYLGQCYQYGLEVHKDLQQARYWYPNAIAELKFLQ